MTNERNLAIEMIESEFDNLRAIKSPANNSISVIIVSERISTLIKMATTLSLITPQEEFSYYSKLTHEHNKL